MALGPTQTGLVAVAGGQARDGRGKAVGGSRRSARSGDHAGDGGALAGAVGVCVSAWRRQPSRCVHSVGSPFVRPLVVVYHPSFSDLGGGEMVCAWVLQELGKDHEVCVVCCRRPDWVRIDRRFSTSLAARPPAFERIRNYRREMDRITPGRARFLALALEARALNRIHRRLRPARWVSTFNAVFLPATALQYIHYPERPVVTRAPADWPVWRRLGFGAMKSAGMALGLGALVDPLRHRSLANSRWTAAGVVRALGVEAEVVYPPVPAFPEGLGWEKREDRVVSLGRWHPHKRLELAIEIVAGARAAGADLRLVLAGFWDPECPSDYRERLRAMSAGRAWIEWREALPFAELAVLAGSSRYGLHCMEAEHFGIAIAELLTAGCVTLVHDSGGAPEIVGDDRLVYRDAAEGSARLERLAADPVGTRELHAAMRGRGLRFSPEAFCAAFRRAFERG